MCHPEAWRAGATTKDPIAPEDILGGLRRLHGPILAPRTIVGLVVLTGSSDARRGACGPNRWRHTR